MVKLYVDQSRLHEKLDYGIIVFHVMEMNHLFGIFPLIKLEFPETFYFPAFLTQPSHDVPLTFLDINLFRFLHISPLSATIPRDPLFPC